MSHVENVSGKNHYAYSTATFLERTTVAAGTLWPASKYIDLAVASGYDGIELWPQRFRLTFQILRKGFSQVEKDHILSTHQCPKIQPFSSSKDLQIAIALPSLLSSLKYQRLINQQVGNIPNVMFKETSGEALQKSGLSKRYIQTDPELNTEWDVQHPEDFIQKAYARGFNGVVIDTHHIRRPDNNTGEPSRYTDILASIKALAQATQELHIGVGRIDFGNMDYQEIKDECYDLLNNGTNNTEIIRMLKTLERRWRGLVVIEMRSSVLKDVAPGISIPEAHEKIRGTLYHIFRS